ncbi:MAG: hypothetical protein GF401_04115 [Chitinivibrionales bacterium]|nr:hypothetical protein [Chitinivibrionales bacterium]
MVEKAKTRKSTGNQARALLPEASLYADQCTDLYGRINALIFISNICQETGQTKEAKRLLWKCYHQIPLLKDIPSRKYKSMEIASRFMDLDICRPSLTLIKKLSRSQITSYQLFELIEKLRKAGKAAVADDCICRIEKNSKAFFLESDKSFIYCRIAEYYINAGNTSKGLKYLARAESWAGRGKYAHIRCYAYSDVADSYRKAGKTEKCRVNLGKSLACARKRRNLRSMQDILLVIRKYHASGESRRSRELLSRQIRKVFISKSDNLSCDYMLELSDSCCMIGMRAKALELLELLLRQARKKRYYSELIRICRGFMDAGDLAGAERIVNSPSFKKADPFFAFFQIGSLAKRFLMEGDSHKAEKYLRQSLDGAYSIGQYDMKALLIATIAGWFNDSNIFDNTLVEECKAQTNK